MDPLSVFEFIVIGSGPSGVHAAQTLVEAGKSVLMLDAGIDNPYKEKLPAGDFFQIRRSDPEQYRLWLGDKMEGISFDVTRTGSQLTPSKKFTSALVDQLTPINSTSFFPLESLARGGLGNAWGLGCYTFSDEELRQCGLPLADMRKAYQVISNRIGVSAPSADIEKYMAEGLEGLLPPIQPDENSKRILLRYQNHKKYFSTRHFFLGVPSLALLTRDKEGRSATLYDNMEFYGDEGNAAWRPHVALEKLKKERRFRYIDQLLVTKFTDGAGQVTVEAIHVADKVVHSFCAPRLIIACNVLGTARIVLRSFSDYQSHLPLLCNSYSYVPSLQLSRLGKRDEGKRTGTAQLCLFHDATGDQSDIATASLYSYSSLMMFRIINEMPLNFKDARIFLQYLMPAITIAGVHMPDAASPQKWVGLQKTNGNLTGDILSADFSFSPDELASFSKREKLFNRALRRLGCIPLRHMHNPPGASIHYAGTLPFSNEDAMLRLTAEGRLGGTRNIFIADGSGFRYLPAKGISLSLMANAHRTALNALKNE